LVHRKVMFSAVEDRFSLGTRLSIWEGVSETLSIWQRAQVAC
jgi:hypothetical protein